MLRTQRVRDRSFRGTSPSTGTVAAPYFPTTLALTSLWEDFAGVPWTDAASAGTSGNKTFDSALPPSVGTALSGHGTASYDGVNDSLLASGVSGDYLHVNDGSIVVLFKAAAASADAGVGSRDANPQFFVDSNGVVGVGFSSAGIQVFTNDPSNGQQYIVKTCGTGAWHLLQAKYHCAANSLDLRLRLDSASWDQVTSGFGNGLFALGGFVFSGTRATGLSPFYNGLVASIMTSKSFLSDANFDSIKAAINTKFGLSL